MPTAVRSAMSLGGWHVSGHRSECWRAASIEAKRVGKSGRYFSVLNWASEYGLSLLTCGREWDWVTPRSASSRATGLDVIELPRSACRVSWSRRTFCLAQVCQTFFGWYNDEHRHTGLGLHVPADVHYGRAQAVHAERASVLDAAYAAHPE